jgi:hypothetical protein
MKRTILIPITGLVLVLTVSAALWVFLARVERLADYYPLEPVGRHWEYAISEVGSSSSPRTGTAVFTALGPGSFEGKETLTISVRREMDGARDEVGARVAVINHMTVANGAVHQSGVEWANTDDPRQGGKVAYSPPVTIGRMPLAVGQTWESRTKITSPRETENDFQADSTRYARVIGRESVTVPAGRFDAIRIETRTVTTRLGSTRPSESTRTEWRARGVGVVRLTEGRFELALKSHGKK